MEKLTFNELCRGAYDLLQLMGFEPPVEGPASCLVANQDRFKQRGLGIGVPEWRQEELRQVLQRSVSEEEINALAGGEIPAFLR